MSNKLTQKSTLSMPTAIAYGFGSQFTSIIAVYMVAYYQLPFFTEVLGLPTTTAASLMSIRQTLALFTMTFGGMIIDAFPLKSGKLRGWCLIGGILYMPLTVVLMCKFNMSITTYMVFHIVFFVLSQIAYTLWWSSGRALVGPMSKTSYDGVLLTTAAMALATLGGSSFGIISTPILSATAGNDNPYFVAMIFFSSFSIIGGVLLYYLTKKYDPPRVVSSADGKKEKQKGTSVREMLSAMKGPGIWFMLSSSFSCMRSGFFSNLLFYFASFVLLDPRVVGLSVTIQSICSFVGSLTMPFLNKFFSKKQIYIAVHFATAASYAALFFFGRHNSLMFLILCGIVGFVQSGQGVTLPALANDLSDYKEMKGEAAARGFVQSMLGLATKIGGLVSTACATYGLAMIGYTAGETVTAGIANGIMFVMALCPAIVCIIAGVFMLFFKIDEKELDEYKNRKAAEQGI